MAPGLEGIKLFLTGWKQHNFLFKLEFNLGLLFETALSIIAWFKNI